MNEAQTIEEFSLALFKDYSTNLLIGLEDFVSGAKEDGLNKTTVYIDFITKLKEICDKALAQIN